MYCAGKSRSITLSLAYLMHHRDWTLREALDFVQRAKPAASPNAGFMMQLLKLDQQLNGVKTVKVCSTKHAPGLMSKRVPAYIFIHVPATCAEQAPGQLMPACLDVCILMYLQRKSSTD